VQYLTGSTGAYLESGLCIEHNIGLMIQPGNAYYRRVHHYPAWAADNGSFSERRAFDAAKFTRLLERPQLQASKQTCLFVVAPDVIGEARKTLDQFEPWAYQLQTYGFPVALVAQDVLETMLDDVPWSIVDVLFVGGTTEWKLSTAAQVCVAYAQRLGKRTHMGRVNSYKRLTLAHSWGINSADGTFLAYGPDVNFPQLSHWLNELKKQSNRTA
jgi:hypothetical protein